MFLFVITKPQIIYDYNRNEYKGFGNGEGKTFFTLPVLSIIIAVFISIIFCSLGNVNNDDKNKNDRQIKYIPVPMNYYPMVQNMSNTHPFMTSSTLPDMTSSLQHAFPITL
jgi:hypothetical protein